MTNADYKSCPVGIKNEADIKHLAKTFDLRLDGMVERIEEKIDAMDKTIQLEFKQMNEKIDVVSTRVGSLDSKVGVLDKKLDGVDNLENFIEEKIDEKIVASTKDRVFSFVKWVVVTLLGGAALTVVTTLVLRLLK